MPHRQPAAIFIQVEKPHPDRQQRMCQRFAEKRGLRVLAICRRWPDCYVMVVNRYVEVVIAATHPGDEVVERIEAVGGQVCVVRQRTMPLPRLRRDVAGLAARMRRRGYDTREIAIVLEIDSQEVRRLRRGTGE